MTHKILIADDEPNIVISLEFLMKREGHEVLLARDGDEALAAIRRERPDLVLLDVMMPGKSGFDVCQAVRADEALAGVKILMLTAKGRDTDIAKGIALGRQRLHDQAVLDPRSSRQRVRESLLARRRVMRGDRREPGRRRARARARCLRCGRVAAGCVFAATLERPSGPRSGAHARIACRRCS